MKKFFTLTFLCSSISFFDAIALPKLNSFPSAQATIFLDFDGQDVLSTSWNMGGPLHCASSQLSDVQIIEIFNRVSEDFRPFNINITTDSATFLNAPLNLRMRVIITPTSDWYKGVGGVSYTGSFTWGDDTPAFVFCDRLGPNNPKMVAECCTHESGHTVGLSHQSKYDENCTLTSVYNDGRGAGETGWAPVMGNSYYKNLSGWSNGPTPYGCSSSQDNLSIITSNGFGYRPDDHSDDPFDNPTLININNQSFSANGIITTTTDKDAFELDIPKASTVTINVLPYSIGSDDEGADIDLKVTLLNTSGEVIKVYDLPDALNVLVDTALNSGRYYLVVDGTGNANTSDYGSLGSYSINGTLSPLGTTPVTYAMLTGNANGNNHDFNWNIISEEKIKSLVLESSNDGKTFSILSDIDPLKKSFAYEPSLISDKYYRLQATTISGKIIYSNVIVLKAGLNKKVFIITTFVHDEIIVKATEDYQYRLSDISGRTISKGKNPAGINKMNIGSNPKGIYFLQLTSNNKRQIERILRQ